jgi:hypothetical protein
VQRLWIVVVAACSGGSPSGSTTASPATESSDPGTDTLPTGAPGRIEGRLQVEPASQCGGAMPEPGFVPPPLAPAPGRTLDVTVGAIYRGRTPVLELTTDADGMFAGQLPAGRYCITLQGRGPKPANMGPHYDLPCLVTQWERCEAVVDVPVTSPVVVDVHERCAGLSCYHGPPPP